MKLFIKNEWYNFKGGKALIVERTDTHVLANVNEQGVKKYRTDCNFHNEVFYPLGKYHDPKKGHAPQCTAQMKWVGDNGNDGFSYLAYQDDHNEDCPFYQGENCDCGAEGRWQ